jgi:hypothetical protein
MAKIYLWILNDQKVYIPALLFKFEKEIFIPSV